MLSACMNIFAAVPDVAIASILCTILYQSRTGSSKSNMLINRLVSSAWGILGVCTYARAIDGVRYQHGSLDKASTPSYT